MNFNDWFFEQFGPEPHKDKSLQTLEEEYNAACGVRSGAKARSR